jgi:hypothetical protein
MKDTFYEVYSDVEKSIDYAFRGKFTINLYQYLKVKEAKRQQVEDFLSSPTSSNISEIVKNLDEYIEGGPDNLHKQLREAYGHIPKPEARKIRNYLHQMLEDCLKYVNEKQKRRKR